MSGRSPGPRLSGALDAAAVVGVGLTQVTEHTSATSAGLAARALSEALQDAGLERGDVDGYVWNLGRPSGDDYDRVIEALGLDVRFAQQFWTHGRFTGTALMAAFGAVALGLADVVACVGGLKRTASSAAAYGETHFGHTRIGMPTLAHEAALVARRYRDLHGLDRSRLADVVRASRAHAAHNPLAHRRDPVELAEYLAAPMLADPLSQLDVIPQSATGVPGPDCGACVLVARSDLAGDRAVRVVGAQGLRASREEVYFGRPGLGLFTQHAEWGGPDDRDRAVFRQAGVGPEGVDAFFTYDAFSPLVWYALERFGYCAPGEAADFARLERIGPGGDLPVNTHGGLLSEGHTGGWGHMVEMVRQLRGEAGARQVPGARLVQWGTVFGDSLLLSGRQPGHDRDSPHRWGSA